KRIGQVTFDVVIADARADGDGEVSLLDWIKRERPSLPVILVTATGAIQEAVDAMRRGAFHYLTRPCDPAQLRAVVDDAVVDRRRWPAGPSDGLGVVPARGTERPRNGPPAIHANMDLVGSGPAMSR